MNCLYQDFLTHVFSVASCDFGSTVVWFISHDIHNKHQGYLISGHLTWNATYESWNSMWESVPLVLSRRVHMEAGDALPEQHDSVSEWFFASHVCIRVYHDKEGGVSNVHGKDLCTCVCGHRSPSESRRTWQMRSSYIRHFFTMSCIVDLLAHVPYLATHVRCTNVRTKKWEVIV